MDAQAILKDIFNNPANSSKYFHEFTDVCSIHGETDFVKILEYPAKCKQCSEIEREEARKKQAAAERRDLMLSVMENCGISVMANGFDAWQYDPNPQQAQRQRQMISNLQGYVKNFTRDNPNILLTGGTGSGKTMLTNATLRALFVQNYRRFDGTPSRLIKSSEIARKVRNSWNDKTLPSEDMILCELSKYDLLAIDDLGDSDASGSQSMIDADRGRIGQIIDMRYQKVPTIITTNFPVDAVASFIGDRAFDRFQQRLVVIECDWDSHRKLTAQVAKWWVHELLRNQPKTCWQRRTHKQTL